MSLSSRTVCLVLTLTLSLSALYADIVDRMREPVIVRTDPSLFPRWVGQGIPTANFELWTFRNSSWEVVPFQIDDVSDNAEDVKQYMDDIPERHCVIDNTSEIPSGIDGPCEFQYDMRGTSAPTGTLTKNDELVFFAGSGGSCSAPESNWPYGTTLESYRYRILVGDSTESGCVYLFRRLSGSGPTVPDLIDYDTTGDGVPATCRPTVDACGAIVGQSYDIDGDTTDDVPAYQADFHGNWAMNKLMIGEICPPASPCPSQDLLDIQKWRIDGPVENEYQWDLYSAQSACGTFRGFIDGPVRVIRVIQGSQSGALSTKYEFAYPGELRVRVYMRVHTVGTLYTYPDLLEANVSPGTSTGTVYRTGADFDGDGVDGSGPSCSTGASCLDINDFWYQVSADRGSFLLQYGEKQFPMSVGFVGRYDDTETPLWSNPTWAPEWDDEDGERAAVRIEWGPFDDTQNPLCEDPRDDGRTGIHNQTIVMLSGGSSASTVGSEIVADRERGVFSIATREEERDTSTPPPPPLAPCTSTLTVDYDNDGGPAHFGATIGCSISLAGWNLYQSVGAGVYKRVASLPLGADFAVVDMALNEERTYVAAALGVDGAEGPLSPAVTLLHDDTVAPGSPEDLAATVVGTTVFATWSSSPSPDVVGYKLQAGTTSGGPYNQVHPGIIPVLTKAQSFEAAPGSTYYMVIKAIDAAGNESLLSPEVTVVVP